MTSDLLFPKTNLQGESDMHLATGCKKKKKGPKRRARHYAYNESVDEVAKLILDESVDIEGANPADENEPVESVAEDDTSPPVFKE